MRERRYKVFYMSPELLIAAGMGGKVAGEPGNQITEFVSCDLPEGAEIVDVTYCWERRAFGFRVWHQAWDIILEGHTIPELTVNCTRHRQPVPQPVSNPKWPVFPLTPELIADANVLQKSCTVEEIAKWFGVPADLCGASTTSQEQIDGMPLAKDEPPAEKKVTFREFF